MEIRDVSENWKKTDVTLIKKISLEENPENYRPVSLTSVPGKAMKLVLLGAITAQMKMSFGRASTDSPRAILA